MTLVCTAAEWSEARVLSMNHESSVENPLWT
jgi:hypothetical protein